MTEQLEQDLRVLFAEDADRAPDPTGLASGVRRRVRRRRQVRLAWGAGALAAASVVTFAVVQGGQPGEKPNAGPPDPTTSQSPFQGKGALPDGGALCVEQYSAAAVTGRAFAFDGTVTEIGPGTSDRKGAELGYAGVTFTVHEWFSGGSGPAVTVDMASPDGNVISSVEQAPGYEVGTRLLVSGEPRWGGAPLDDAIAWGCGFTRYYDEETADRWRAAFD
jgi:hypothetical protein